MKNKKLAYILLPMVALIWALLMYKLYVKFFGGGEILNVVVQNSQEQNVKSKIEEFELIADYRDPFLGNNISEPDAVVSSPPMQRPAVVIVPSAVPKPFVRWPQIKPGGVVGKKKFIGVINGKNVFINLGEEEHGVKFLNFSKDSIWLKFSTEIKSFPQK